MTKSIESEQELCVECGFCCDNTLFDIASFKPKENKPPKFEKLIVDRGDGQCFELPCTFFDCKCTIYDQHKPLVCGTFRCKYLKSYSNSDRTLSDALEVINEIKKQRDEILNVYTKETGKKLSFRKVLWELRNLRWKNKMNSELEVIYQKAQLLEFHLSVHFQSDESFEKQFETIDNNE